MVKFLCPNDAILDSHCAVILFSASPFVGRKLKIILQYIYIFFMPLAVDGWNLSSRILLQILHYNKLFQSLITYIGTA